MSEPEAETTRPAFAKVVAKLAVATSTGTTVSAILKNALPVATRGSTQLQYVIGVYALSGIASTAAAAWFGREYDEIAEALDKIKGNKNETSEDPA